MIVRILVLLEILAAIHLTKYNLPIVNINSPNSSYTFVCQHFEYVITFVINNQLNQVMIKCLQLYMSKYIDILSIINIILPMFLL
jgi:hypothetical protein